MIEKTKNKEEDLERWKKNSRTSSRFGFMQSSLYLIATTYQPESNLVLYDYSLFFQLLLCFFLFLCFSPLFTSLEPQPFSSHGSPISNSSSSPTTKVLFTHFLKTSPGSSSSLASPSSLNKTLNHKTRSPNGFSPLKSSSLVCCYIRMITNNTCLSLRYWLYILCIYI